LGEVPSLVIILVHFFAAAASAASSSGAKAGEPSLSMDAAAAEEEERKRGSTVASWRHRISEQTLFPVVLQGIQVGGDLYSTFHVFVETHFLAPPVCRD
jgi:hypothetical protein